MKFEKIHFLYEPKKEPAASFAENLIKELGQCDAADADVIVCVGGDGLLLQALHNAKGKPIFGLTAPGSNSCGFWLEHGIENAEQLKEKLEDARPVPLRPLEAQIKFSNGKSVLKHAFNSVAIERASGQAVLMHLSATLGDNAIVGPHRIMGDGFIFSTALGSTGLNRSYSGPAIDIHNDVIILTGKGIYEPRGISPIVLPGTDSVLKVDFCSATTKRPLRIDYDGKSIEKDEDGSSIDSVILKTSNDATVNLLVNTPTALKVFTGF